MALWYFEDEHIALGSPAHSAGLTYLRSPAFIAIQIRVKSDDSHTSLIRLSSDVCTTTTRQELATYIDSLKPLTLAKLADASYRAKLTDLNNQLSQIRPKNEEDRLTQRKTEDQNIQVPRWTVGGLPGFKYPEKLLPRLMKIEAPSSSDLKPLPEEISRLRGIPLGEAMRQDTSASFNFNVPSRLMGPPQQFDQLVSSGFEAKRGWLCMELPNFRFPDLKLPPFVFSFKVKLPDFPNLPNVHIEVPNIITLPPCIAQHIPPLMMPKVELPHLSIGGGEEFAIFKNGKKVMDNFGKGFNPLFRGVPSAGIKMPSAIKGAATAIGGAVSKINSATNAIGARAFNLQSQLGVPLSTNLKGVGFQLPGVNNSKFNEVLSKLSQSSISIPGISSRFSQNPIFNVDTTRFKADFYRTTPLSKLTEYVNPIKALPDNLLSKAVTAANGGRYSIKTNYGPPYVYED